MKKPLSISFNSPKTLRAVKAKVKKLLWYLGKNAFLFILIFILLDILFAEVIFYVYMTSIEEEPESVVIPTKFQKNTYDSVLKQWKARNYIFENKPQENYSNPFE